MIIEKDLQNFMVCAIILPQFARTGFTVVPPMAVKVS